MRTRRRAVVAAFLPAVATLAWPMVGFTIEFDNKDLGIPHNVSIYDTANGSKALYKGEVVYGPRKITYTVPAQAKGTYEFICDPHAEFMRGTFIVG